MTDLMCNLSIFEDTVQMRKNSRSSQSVLGVRWSQIEVWESLCSDFALPPPARSTSQGSCDITVPPQEVALFVRERESRSSLSVTKCRDPQGHNVWGPARRGRTSTRGGAIVRLQLWVDGDNNCSNSSHNWRGVWKSYGLVHTRWTHCEGWGDENKVQNWPKTSVQI